jgi:dipeptidase E
MGGGGFTAVPYDGAIDRHILALTGKRRPRICFIGTASGDDAAYVKTFYRRYRRLRCSPTHLPLFMTTVTDIDAFLRAQDAIFVGGGNTRDMLCLWKLWGVDRALRAAYERGAIVAGVSAGGLAWFHSGLTDSFPKRYAPLRCLGWLKGSFCPHYDGEAKRQPVLRRTILDGSLPAGYAVEDGAALVFVDETLRRVISWRKGATAYRVERARERFVRTALEAEPL